MNNKNTSLRFLTLLLSLFILVQADAQNDKGKGKKEHPKESQRKDKKDKGNHAIKDESDPQQGKEHKDNNQHDKNVKEKKHNPTSKGRNEANGKDGYKWDRETFKNRNKLKKEEKVTLCHKVKGDGEPGVTLKVSSHALQAHLKHGDVKGECAVTTNKRYSNHFLDRRTYYYSNIQNTEEQVYYSKSVLTYALARLTDSRQQLSLMQKGNTPVQVIEQKKATVAELEENVSLLETLIGITVNVVANKLQ
jgi:hypothetical protein